MSEKLVELHGGVIKAESEGKDKGSTFSIQIPLANEKEKKELEYSQEKA